MDHNSLLDWAKTLLPGIVAIAAPYGAWLIHKSRRLYGKDRQASEQQRTLDTVMGDVAKAGMQHASSLNEEWRQIIEMLRKEISENKREMEEMREELEECQKKHFEQMESILLLKARVSQLERH